MGDADGLVGDTDSLVGDADVVLGLFHPPVSSTTSSECGLVALDDDLDEEARPELARLAAGEYSLM